MVMKIILKYNVLNSNQYFDEPIKNKYNILT